MTRFSISASIIAVDAETKAETTHREVVAPTQVYEASRDDARRTLVGLVIAADPEALTNPNCRLFVCGGVEGDAPSFG